MTAEPHEGSQGTYDHIATWISPNFFFSAKDQWGRMGILGVFSDLALSCLEGDILEIGCGESSIYLSHVAKKYKRRIFHCDIAPSKLTNPLTVPDYFALPGLWLDADFKDQEPGYTPEVPEAEKAIFFAGPSDQIFKEVAVTPLAFSFIDGDHNYAQAKKDFDNIFALTVDHGFICLHDTYPSCDEELSEHRCGDVYKLRQELEEDPRLDVLTFTRGCVMGVGITVCRKKPAERKFYHG